MFDIVDTAFKYERELIVCWFLEDFFKEKESSLQLLSAIHMYTDCLFTLWGRM